MHSAVRALIVVGCATVALVGPVQRDSRAQGFPPVIEGLYPTQMPVGQTTVLYLGVPRANVVKSVEFAPAAGLTVSGIKEGDFKTGMAWWEVTVVVAADAAPGNRALTIVGSAGRTTARNVTIPVHVPRISDLRVLSAQVSQPVMDFQFAIADAAGDVGDVPMVWFTLDCGGEPELGAVAGKAANGVVRASVPNPRSQPKAGANVLTNRCDFQVRASDSKGADSNTLTSTVEFK
jgi:hypothetical protein